MISFQYSKFNEFIFRKSIMSNTFECLSLTDIKSTIVSLTMEFDLSWTQRCRIIWQMKNKVVYLLIYQLSLKCIIYHTKKIATAI